MSARRVGGKRHFFELALSSCYAVAEFVVRVFDATMRCRLYGICSEDVSEVGRCCCDYRLEMGWYGPTVFAVILFS